MKDLIIPLNWESVDGLLAFIDDHLLRARMPTILRMRTRAMTEELFVSLLGEPGRETARLRCTCPAPGQICLQYRNAAGPLTPDLTVLKNLLAGAAGYGVKAEIRMGSCTFTVGVR